jgi:DNA-binding FadR family transcriptional regulator
MPVGSPTIASSEERRVFNRILEYFCEVMRDGKLRPGDRLLSERELSSNLGVSRSSLRETLRAMAMLGLVEIIPKQGAFVLSPNSRSAFTFFGLTLSLKPQISEAIMELRIVIECGAARLAARRASKEEVAIMRACIARMPLNKEGGDTGAEADFEFHGQIIKATHSEFLISVYEAIQELLAKSHRERRKAVLQLPGILEELVNEHLQIYYAIAEGNEDLAEANMYGHFMKSYARDKSIRKI